MQACEFQQSIFVDDRRGQRVQAEKGLVVNVEMGKEPKTERPYVAKSDSDILAGCLSACIRTGAAKLLPPTPAPVPSKK